jgi:hypothetical protein
MNTSPSNTSRKRMKLRHNNNNNNNNSNAFKQENMLSTIVSYLTNKEIYQSTLTLNRVFYTVSWAQLDKTVDNQWAIRRACAKGHVDLVRQLLQCKEVDPSVNNSSALVWACSSGNLDIVQLLLSSNKVRVNDQDNAPLIAAAMRGRNNIVKLLLSYERVDINAQENSALLNAIECKHIDTALILLDNPRINPFYPDGKPLYLAHESGSVELITKIRVLIQRATTLMRRKFNNKCDEDGDVEMYEN